MRMVVVLLLLCGVGCGGTTTTETTPVVGSVADPRIEQLRKDFAATGQNLSDSELRELITAREKEHGTATHDQQGYPLYELLPWEKAKPEWSWSDPSRPFVVSPDRTTQSHVKSAPSVEHRYVEIYYPKTTAPVIVEAAAQEVWHHFAREIDERHPQATLKMVTVKIYVDGQESEMPVGRVWNNASEKLPDHPKTEWFQFNKSSLVFNPTE
jgi:hypothetical protein